MLQIFYFFYKHFLMLSIFIFWLKKYKLFLTHYIFFRNRLIVMHWQYKIFLYTWFDLIHM
jgi:hypothetical protein